MNGNKKERAISALIPETVSIVHTRKITLGSSKEKRCDRKHVG
jgi:hypothetical protein